MPPLIDPTVEPGLLAQPACWTRRRLLTASVAYRICDRVDGLRPLGRARWAALVGLKYLPSIRREALVTALCGSAVQSQGGVENHCEP